MTAPALRLTIDENAPGDDQEFLEACARLLLSIPDEDEGEDPQDTEK